MRTPRQELSATIKEKDVGLHRLSVKAGEVEEYYEPKKSHEVSASGLDASGKTTVNGCRSPRSSIASSNAASIYIHQIFW